MVNAGNAAVNWRQSIMAVKPPADRVGNRHGYVATVAGTHKTDPISVKSQWRIGSWTRRRPTSADISNPPRRSRTTIPILHKMPYARRQRICSSPDIRPDPHGRAKVSMLNSQAIDAVPLRLRADYPLDRPHRIGFYEDSLCVDCRV